MDESAFVTEFAALAGNPAFAGAQRLEVEAGLGHHVGQQLEDQSAGRRLADGDVQVHEVVPRLHQVPLVTLLAAKGGE